MPNIQIVRENSLGINRGLYGDTFGNTLSSPQISTLLAEHAAVEVGTNAGVPNGGGNIPVVLSVGDGSVTFQE